MKFAFRVVVQLTKSEGAGTSKDEIYDEIVGILEGANPEGIEIGEGVYDVVEWAVLEDVATKERQPVGQPKPEE